MIESTRRRLLFWSASLPLALGLTACAGLQPGPRTVDISEARLAQMIAGQFPFNSRYLEIFDVSLAAPRVRLLPAENRIGTEVAYSIGTLFGTRPTQGTLSLSYGLRFEPSDNSVRLSEVRIDSFEVPGVPQAYANRASRLGALLAEGLLQDFAIHRFSADDLAASQRWGYRPGAMTVLPGGLRLQLDPVPRN
ncbi:DUF1439 domain-containing protein [Hydrogenophaga sp.]|uniref:DUF1439 domain-containing protein n=1 Tax=Hydrogenophaga sp. TaxID=1904254 RepID=UPI00356371D4